MVDVIAFYHPGHDEPCDKLCGAPFLGNFFVLAEPLLLKAPSSPQQVSFWNSEAAFQALKFWTRAEDFASLSGDEAFQLKKRFAGQEDFFYGGYGSNWAGMLAVLRQKFAQKSMGDALLKTADAFLLEHNSVEGRDKVWSDNCKGDGTNWLGLQCMLIRDELSKRHDWTSYIGMHVDLSTGSPRSNSSRDEWQGIIKRATQTLADALVRNHLIPPPGHICLRHGCGKTTWNGQPNEYCGKAHRQDAMHGAPSCAKPGCGKPTWNGKPGEYCSKSPKQGK